MGVNMLKNSLRTLFILWCLATLGIVAQAQTAVVLQVTPRWNPPTELTSLETNGTPGLQSGTNGTWTPGVGDDDDIRYLGVNLYATTNMEIWAANFSCTVPTTFVELYTANFTNDDPYDAETSYAGTAWGSENTDFTILRSSNFATGVHQVTISRMGQIPGIGQNGTTNTFELGYLQYRIKAQALNTFTGTVSLTCTGTFLDRNGASLGAIAFQTVPPANLRYGYSITGVVQYQAQANHAGIGVSCLADSNVVDANQLNTSAPNNGVAIRTTATGAFAFNGLRKQGWYRCQYFANILGVEAPTANPTPQVEPFMISQRWVELSGRNSRLIGNSYQLLPTTLVAGNVERLTSSGDINTLNDLGAVTSNFNSVGTLAYRPGDANGDRNVNQSDLAIVTSNLNYSNTVGVANIIVSGQRQNTGLYPDNRIWTNTSPSPFGIGYPVYRQLVAGTNSDYWPELSPDGRQMIVTRAVRTGTNVEYALFLLNTDGTGVATRLTPAVSATFPYDAFAASWSPDGGRIAFVCSFRSGTYRAYQFDTGNLCLIDVTGRNFIDTGGDTKIYPPAWWTQDDIIFGSRGICTNTLCQYNTINRFFQELDTTLTTDSNNVGTEDMPNTWDGRLYYRYDADGIYNGGTTLRFATLDFDLDGDWIEPFQVTPPAGGCCTTEYHMEINVGGDVDYYVTPEFAGEQVLVSLYEINGGFYYSGYNWKEILLDGGTFYSGFAPAYSIFNHTLSGVYSNPAWNLNVNSPTDLWGLRVSLKFLF
jgi:hypothetical protein